MIQPHRHGLLSGILIVAGFVLSILIGIGMGTALAATRRIQSMDQFEEHKPALPTQILDRKERLITQFFSEEKREIVSIDEIPKSIIHAILTREDKFFYQHHGFRFWYIIGAAFDILTGRSFRGGSTLTQQLAGHLYADRTDISLKRKVVELWWAIQLERALTKNEILERYLNLMYFGHNTYGVEAASQFYFKHSVRQITLAESAMLVIQLANPGRYSPINNPNRAQKMQREILDQMVASGQAAREEADRSFQEYWDSYDFTRSNITSAWFEREDKAPYFSEYVRQQMEDQLLGAMDLYKEGLVVHTTLDLDYQAVADRIMERDIPRINHLHQSQSERRVEYSDQEFLPIVDLLSLAFNIEDIRFVGSKQKARARALYLEQLNPVLDVSSMLFGLEPLKHASLTGYAELARRSRKTQVEGALVAIDSRTGHILAMIGGRKFESTNQFNRATQAQVQPGSAFKPLYYSAAFSSRKFTPATLLMDSPVVFWNDDGTPYVPLNYKGEWKGRVLLRYALAHSMNIPSLKVLDGIGFDAAITRASRMLGVDDPAEIDRIFPRKYPLGLGVITVSPLEMARAFAAFPNRGREVEPIAIRYVEDRNGRLVFEPEKELRSRQLRRGDALQIMSPQEAYLMVNVLQTAVESGTLQGAREVVGGFGGRPIAGKTGTTQNWSDAWTIGFTPQVTAAVWFGFDELGYSLGVNLSGANSAGMSWAEFMRDVHRDLPVEEFQRPATGMIEVNVCSESGLLPTRYCPTSIREIFLAGTEPHSFCDYHEYKAAQKELIKENIKSSILVGELYSSDLGLPEFPGIDGGLTEWLPGAGGSSPSPPAPAPGLPGPGAVPPDGATPAEPPKTWNPLLD
jgi:penicillin-binding protein 1A